MAEAYRPILLDASVLIPTTLREFFLTCATHELFRPIWSNPILDEFEQGLATRAGLAPEQATRIRAKLESAFPHSAIAVSEKAAKSGEGNRAATTIATAVRGGAHTIVAASPKALGEETARVQGIEVITPDAFLNDLFNAHRRTILAALAELGSAISRSGDPALTALKRLAVNTPSFGAYAALALEDRHF